MSDAPDSSTQALSDARTHLERARELARALGEARQHLRACARGGERGVWAQAWEEAQAACGPAEKAVEAAKAAGKRAVYQAPRPPQTLEEARAEVLRRRQALPRLELALEEAREASEQADAAVEASAPEAEQGARRVEEARALVDTRQAEVEASLRVTAEASRRLRELALRQAEQADRDAEDPRRAKAEKALAEARAREVEARQDLLKRKAQLEAKELAMSVALARARESGEAIARAAEVQGELEEARVAVEEAKQSYDLARLDVSQLEGSVPKNAANTSAQAEARDALEASIQAEKDARVQLTEAEAGVEAALAATRPLRERHAEAQRAAEEAKAREAEAGRALTEGEELVRTAQRWVEELESGALESAASGLLPSPPLEAARALVEDVERLGGEVQGLIEAVRGDLEAHAPPPAEEPRAAAHPEPSRSEGSGPEGSGPGASGSEASGSGAPVEDAAVREAPAHDEPERDFGEGSDEDMDEDEGPSEVRPTMKASREEIMAQADALEDSEAETRTTFSLVVSTKDAALGTFEFDQEVVTVGRERGCNVHLDNPLVSRRHAEIRRQGTFFAIVDKGTANGTFVNGKQVEGMTLLNGGDTIGIGKFRLKFQAKVASGFLVGEEDLDKDPNTLGGMTIQLSPQAAKRAVDPGTGQRGYVILPREGPDLRLFISDLFQVGKDPQCDLLLGGWLRIPRKAALIVRTPKQYVLVNVGPSVKAVKVNGVGVADRAPLKDGDRIEVYGQKLGFRINEE